MFMCAVLCSLSALPSQACYSRQRPRPYLLLTTYYLLLAGLLLAAEAETSRGARERAGVISSFALMVGLSVGSASGLLISKTVAAPT
jgi:hypothetical protein